MEVTGCSPFPDLAAAPTQLPEGEDYDQNQKKTLGERRLKILGVTEEEMKRWSALKKMGLTNDDFEIGCQIMTEGNVEKDEDEGMKKTEKLTGYRTSQLRREKAVVVLGTTEEEIDDVNARKLSALGFQGRARSSLK